LAGCSTDRSNDVDGWGQIDQHGERELMTANIGAAELTVDEVVDADVVVLGAGAAGMVAAVSAAEAGADTVLVERYTEFAAPGGGVGSINTSDLLEKGLGTDVEEIVHQLVLASEGRADPRLCRKWAENSGLTTDWLTAIAQGSGIDIVKMGGEHSYTFGVPALTGVALGFYQMLLDHGKRFDMKTRLGTRAIGLIRPGGCGPVTGAMGRHISGKVVRFNAKRGVVVCTGDYGSNPELVEKYAPWVNDCLSLYSIGTNTGDGLTMASEVGALIEESPHCAMIHFNSTNARPASMNRPVRSLPGSNPFLYVNKAGERFSDESMPYEYWSSAVLRQPGKTMWQVFDSKCVNERNKDAVGRATTTGEVLVAPTLEELALQFGADPEKFKHAVNRYNQLVDMGSDPDFGKDSTQLGMAIDAPPYYVCESPPNLLVCMGGPRIDTYARVLDTSYNVIPGLFAAGNVAGGFWGDCYPMSVLSGLARGIATTFGRIAGLGAAAAGS
jgi:fumarate reductase flavoprotein subunit